MTDTTRTDGLTSFDPAQRRGWENMGVYYGDKPGITVEQALADIDAGEIRGVAMKGEFRMNGEKHRVSQPRYQGTYRIRGTVEEPIIVPLAVVGTGFEIIQDTTTFAFMNDVAGEGNEVAAAGLMVHERRTFLCVRLPQVMVGGIDLNGRYLLAYVGHDGGAKLTIAATNVRTDCYNVVNMTIRGAKRKYVVAHRPGANAKLNVELARKALGFTEAYDTAWKAEAEKLISTPVTDAKFWEIVNHAYGPKTETPQAQAQFDARRAQIAAIYNGEHNANIKGTAWGALNVLNEYDGWYRTIRGVDAAEADRRRFERAILGGNDETTRKLQHIIGAVA